MAIVRARRTVVATASDGKRAVKLPHGFYNQGNPLCSQWLGDAEGNELSLLESIEAWSEAVWNCTIVSDEVIAGNCGERFALQNNNC